MAALLVSSQFSNKLRGTAMAASWRPQCSLPGMAVPQSDTAASDTTPDIAPKSPISSGLSMGYWWQAACVRRSSMGQFFAAVWTSFPHPAMPERRLSGLLRRSPSAHGPVVKLWEETNEASHHRGVRTQPSRNYLPGGECRCAVERLKSCPAFAEADPRAVGDGGAYTGVGHWSERGHLQRRAGCAAASAGESR